MKDVQFMSGKEKVLVLKQWITLLRNGFQWKHFTDRVYKHLTLHCSFIAHYDRYGFYRTYFEQPNETTKFLKQFDKDFGCTSVEYGGFGWKNNAEFGDINNAMCEAIEPYKQAIYKTCETDEKKRDIVKWSTFLNREKIFHKWAPVFC